MSVESPAAFLQGASGYAAEQTRRAIFAQYNTAGGVRLTGDLQVTAAASGLSVNVAAGTVFVPGTTSTTQSLYYCLATSTTNLAISSNSSGNPRIDGVYATVDDAAYVGAANDWKLQVVAGTPTSGATLSNLSGAPATPTSSLLLAYVLVPTGASNLSSGDIQDERITLSFAISNASSVVTTEGDLIVGNPSGIATRLAVGSNGYVLTADSTQTNGVGWEKPSQFLSQLFTSSGTYTTANDGTTHTYRLTGVGGGGGGGSGDYASATGQGGGGGGAGAFSELIASVGPNTTLTVTIGAAAAGGTSGGSGASGATTTESVTGFSARGGNGGGSGIFPATGTGGQPGGCGSLSNPAPGSGGSGGANSANGGTGTPLSGPCGGGGGGGSNSPSLGGGGGAAGAVGGIASGGTSNGSSTSNGVAGGSAAANSGCGGGGGGSNSSGGGTGGAGGAGGTGWLLIERLT